MTLIQTRIPSPIDDIIIQGNQDGVSYVGFYPVIECQNTPFAEVELPHILNCAAQLMSTLQVSVQTLMSL